MSEKRKITRPDSSVRLVLNPVVEREYAYLIQKATESKDEARVKALRVGLERARRRADELKAS